MPICRYAINIYTCKEKVLKIGGLRMDKLERAELHPNGACFTW